MGLLVAIAVLAGIVLAVAAVTAPIWIIPLIRSIRRRLLHGFEAKRFELAESRSIAAPSQHTPRATLFVFATTFAPVYVTAMFGATAMSVDPRVLAAITW